MGYQLRVFFEGSQPTYKDLKHELVVDYMRWRMSDSERNALGSWCHWTLIKEGMDGKQGSQPTYKDLKL